MINLLDYIPKDNTWIDEFCRNLGTEYIQNYYHRVWLKLYDMKIGEEFDITKRVKPDNRELFIKMASLCIYELRHEYREWVFSEDGSKIKCV